MIYTKNNQFYELLGKINKQLTKLGEDEIKVNNKTFTRNV